MLAANYLDIKSLIELCCAKVATMIKSTFPLIQTSPHKRSDSSSASSTISPPKNRRKSDKKTSGQKNAVVDIFITSSFIALQYYITLILCSKAPIETSNQSRNPPSPSSRPPPHLGPTTNTPHNPNCPPQSLSSPNTPHSPIIVHIRSPPSSSNSH